VTDTIGQTDTEIQVVQVSGEPEIIFNQTWYDGGYASTSAVDVGNDVDYEAADNFDIGTKGSIDKVVVYGLTLINDGVNWVEMTPDDVEPFIVRFYEYDAEEEPGVEAPVTGTYELALLDDYGDGWNGGIVSVFVNGNPVLTDITLDDGAGPEYHTFDATAGDDITTSYTPGDWPIENYYAILDPDENIIAEEGGTWSDPGASTPGSIGGLLIEEPNWADPVSEQMVDADVEYVDLAWDAYSLYKFEMELPTTVNMDEGWVSVQINADEGSGTWFLWMNSLDGDSFAYQRTDPVLGGGAAGLSLDNEGRDTAPLNDVLAYDLALELWG